MREVVAKSILNKNNMNIYRGCTHGCIYCDSRSECYGMTDRFEDIEVKSNAVELLDLALSKRREKAVITTGAMTDPYIPLEKELCHMRKCLEVIERRGFGVSVLTKSDLLLRDLDLLQRINEKAKCVVQMTLTTYDEELCQKLEPNVASTKERFQVLMELKKAGIPTVVWMTPTLPYINDTEENVKGILGYCQEAGIKGLITFGAGMTLRNGNREYYYQKLDQYFPGIKEKYIKEFGYTYGIGSPRGKRLDQMARDFCRKEHILHGFKRVYEFIEYLEPKEEQLRLW